MKQMPIRRELLKGIAGVAAAAFSGDVAASKTEPVSLPEVLHQVKETAGQLIAAIDKWNAVESQPKTLENLAPSLSAMRETTDAATKLDELIRFLLRTKPHKS